MAAKVSWHWNCVTDTLCIVDVAGVWLLTSGRWGCMTEQRSPIDYWSTTACLPPPVDATLTAAPSTTRRRRRRRCSTTAEWCVRHSHDVPQPPKPPSTDAAFPPTSQRQRHVALRTVSPTRCVYNRRNVSIGQCIGAHRPRGGLRESGPPEFSHRGSGGRAGFVSGL